MAHLPSDELPSEFDLVVVGTGLTQSILAAAAARVGKSVLHLDGNSYYGQYWATLMYNDMEKWIDSHMTLADNEVGVANSEKGVVSQVVINEGEKVIKCNDEATNKVTNLVQTNYSQQLKPLVLSTSTDTQSTSIEATPDDTQLTSDADTQPTSTDTQPTPSDTQPTPSDTQSTPSEPHPSLVTWDDLGNQKRRFNFDLIPKLLYCRGQMVDTITQSGVARYLEFRSLPKLYSYTSAQDKIVQVPCSRADVFTSTIVSMLEKRKLMKVLTFCAEYDQHPNEYQDFIDRPFVDFLRSRDLTENIVQFIVHSIAMINEKETTLKGLKASQVFLQSLGRFGNAPFLFPLFGVGELPQGFARLCAVFGGVYCLKRSVKELIVSQENNQLLGVVCTTGQRIKCSTLIGPAGLVGVADHTYSISRAIYVADGPISGIDEKIGLLTILPSDKESSDSTISVLQLDNSTLCAPEGFYLIHATCNSYGTSAENDLKCVAEKFFTTDPSSSDGKPHLLWSLYYNMNMSRTHSCTGLPGNVVMVSDPDNTIAYEDCMEEVKRIFGQLFPEEEFLPKMPEAEDIIYGEEESNTNEEANEGASPQGDTNKDINEGVSPINQDNTDEETSPDNLENTNEGVTPNNQEKDNEGVFPTNQEDTNEGVSPSNQDT